MATNPSTEDDLVRATRRMALGSASSQAGRDPDQRNAALFAAGLTGHYSCPLLASKAHLDELRRNQEVISESLERENERLESAMNNDELQKLFEKTRRYTEKLVKIRRDMISLQERAAKLKKRALALQLRKQKEAYKKEQQRRAEAEREKALVAKMARPETKAAEKR